MRLNPDSVRAVLLYLEENLEMGEETTSHCVISNILSKNGMTTGYKDDLLYAIKQLSDDNMIIANNISAIPKKTGFKIYDITPNGHRFLNNIRDDNIWNKAKKFCIEKSGSLSLSILEKAAMAIVSKQIGVV